MATLMAGRKKKKRRIITREELAKAQREKREQKRQTDTQRLWHEFKENNSQKAREQLITLYLPLAYRIANSYYHHSMFRRYSISSEHDLKSYAARGLIESVDNFNPSLLIPFEAFSYVRIRGAIVDGLRVLQEFPREIARIRREIKPLIQELTHKLNHFPSIHEIEEEYGAEISEKAQNILFSTGVYNNSLIERNSEGDEIDLWDTLEDKRKESYDIQDRIDIFDEILDSIENAENRFIIYSYYLMGMTDSEIGQILDISTSSVNSRHRKTIIELKKLHKTNKKLLKFIGKSEE